MFVFEYANVSSFYNCAAEDTKIKIVTLHDRSNVLYQGTIRDVRNSRRLQNFIIVEILIDRSKPDEVDLPDYNKSKILVVT